MQNGATPDDIPVFLIYQPLFYKAFFSGVVYLVLLSVVSCRLFCNGCCTRITWLLECMLRNELTHYITRIGGWEGRDRTPWLPRNRKSLGALMLRGSLCVSGGPSWCFHLPTKANT